MTYHIKRQNYMCKKCAVIYIPFNKDIACPNCGNQADTEEHFDFIIDIANSMKAHKIRYGSFMPPAFFCDGSLAANIQSSCLKIFDKFEAAKPKDEKGWLSKAVVEKIEFSEEYKYLIKHITDIIFSIYGLYKKQNKFAPSKLKRWLSEELKKLLPYLP